MYLDHHSLARIECILGQLKTQVMLLDANGQVILPKDNRRDLQLPEMLTRDPTRPLVYGGFTLIGTSDKQPLYLCMAGDSQDVQNCIVVCAELINMVVASDAAHLGREQAVRMILRGEAEGTELEGIATEYNIPVERPRCVMYFHFQEIEAKDAMEILTNITSDEQDVFVEVGRHSIALVKALGEDEEFDELEQMGQATLNTFISETNSPVYIGIGEPKQHIADLHDGFVEAKTAIEVGRLYRDEQQVFVFRKLLIERFLRDVPEDMAKKYNSLLFNRSTARLFNEEMIQTIKKFFENSLNLSETARQLYIHRNTLVYRLDKVQRNIGLDLRDFDDAVTFKLMMLLGRNVHGRKSWN